jgi:hypothetical protein
MAPWHCYGGTSTPVRHIPLSDFKGKTTIQRGLFSNITVYYGSLPMFFVSFLFNFEVWDD